MNIRKHSKQRSNSRRKRGGPLMNLSEVAETLDRTQNTVRSLAAAGVLPPVIQKGRMQYWSAADVQKVLAGVLANKKGGAA